MTITGPIRPRRYLLPYTASPVPTTGLQGELVVCTATGRMWFIGAKSVGEPFVAWPVAPVAVGTGGAKVFLTQGTGGATPELLLDSEVGGAFRCKPAAYFEGRIVITADPSAPFLRTNAQGEIRPSSVAPKLGLSPVWNGATLDFHGPKVVRGESHFLGIGGEWSSYANTGSVLTDRVVEAGHPGIVGLSCAAVSGTTYAGVGVQNGLQLRMTDGDLYFRTIFKTPTLSDATDRYNIICGITDHRSAVNFTPQGCGVRYRDNNNSGKFQLFADSGTSIADTGVTVAANTWYTIELVITSNGTAGACFINGSAAGTVAIDQSTPIDASPHTAMQKTTGTLQRIVLLDYLQYAQVIP